MLGRAILWSEFAIVRAAARIASIPVPPTIIVWEEQYSWPRDEQSQAFNTDFTLTLQPELPTDRIIEVVPVRPKMIGAEFFVVMRRDGVPARLELLGGEAFPKRLFIDLIQEVQRVIQPVCARWYRALANASVLRIAEVEGKISFLASTSRDIGAVARVSPMEVRTESGLVFLRSRNEQELMIDGVLELRESKTLAHASEMYLVAVRKLDDHGSRDAGQS